MIPMVKLPTSDLDCLSYAREIAIPMVIANLGVVSNVVMERPSQGATRLERGWTLNGTSATTLT